MTGKNVDHSCVSHCIRPAHLAACENTAVRAASFGRVARQNTDRSGTVTSSERFEPVEDGFAGLACGTEPEEEVIPTGRVLPALAWVGSEGVGEAAAAGVLSSAETSGFCASCSATHINKSTCGQGVAEDGKSYTGGNVCARYP